jgi:hypothetical protein
VVFQVVKPRASVSAPRWWLGWLGSRSVRGKLGETWSGPAGRPAVLSSLVGLRPEDDRAARKDADSIQKLDLGMPGMPETTSDSLKFLPPRAPNGGRVPPRRGLASSTRAPGWELFLSDRAFLQR